MNKQVEEESGFEAIEPRFSVICVGIVLAFFALTCFLGSIFHLINAMPKLDVASISWGAFILVLSWISLVKARLLLLNKRLDGGLFTPLGLRLSAVLCLCFAGFLAYLCMREKRYITGANAAFLFLAMSAGLLLLAGKREKAARTKLERT